jgi:WD40 repeat protein
MTEFPYPGLRPFLRDETDIFFGREEHTDELLKRLGETHFLAVVGPSGYGKSSLVRTGMLAGLEMGLLASAGAKWCVADLRPANQPFFNLAKALLIAFAQNDDAYSSDDPEAIKILQAKLRRGPLSLHEILQDTPLPEDTSLLLLVDQFEEIFRYFHQGIIEAADFVKLLRKSSEHLSIYIVITMRSDFLGDCALFSGLPEKIDKGLFLTPRFTEKQLHSVIEKPAKVFGGQVEKSLVHRLLNDMGYNPDQLPVLQHALMRMWDFASEKKAENVVLTLEHYEKIGKLSNALSKHAEEAYAELTDTQKKIAETLFRNLTERSQDDRRDTRHLIKLEEVAKLVNVSWQEVDKVVEVFRKPGRSFLVPPHGKNLVPNDVIDISHESLISKWQRLRDWTEQEFEDAKLYRRLEESASLWKDKKAALWGTPDLESALAWHKKAQPTAAQWASRYGKHFDLATRFLNASKKEQKRTWKRKLQGAIVVFAVVITIAIWAIVERYRAIDMEKARTSSLFESQVTHASLLAKNESYTKAKQILKQTHNIDKEILASRRHSRNLLAWFNKLKGGEPQQTYKGANAPLFSVAISPDGKWLAVAGENSTLVLFDVKTGQLIKHLQGHTENVMAVVFHPQGKWLFSVGDDNRIIRWSIPNGDKVEWQKVPTNIRALAINPDGTHLATGDVESNIILWDAKTGDKVRTFDGHTNQIATGGITFSPDGELLASASYDGTARIWIVETGKTLSILEGDTKYSVHSIVFSPDSQLIATSSANKTVHLWNTNTGQMVHVLSGHKNSVFGLSFLDDKGRYLASASFDRTLRVWDTDSGVTLRILQGHSAGVTGIAIHARQLFSASNDGIVIRWNTNLPYQQIVDLPNKPASVAIAPDGNSVAVGFVDGVLRLYSLPKMDLLDEQKAHITPEQNIPCDVIQQCDIQRLTFNTDGSLLSSASFNTTGKLWRVKNGKLYHQQTLSGHTKPLNDIAFSPDNRLIATASYDGQIGLFTVGSEQKQFEKAPHDGKDVLSVDFDASGTRLLSGGKDGYVRLWKLNAKQLTLLKKFPQAQDSVHWTSFSPDNQKIVSVGRDQIVHVYPIHDNQQQHKLAGHDDTIWRAIFSPDNQQLATASADATVRLWDLSNDSELFTLRLPTTNSSNDEVLLWDFDFRCTPKGDCWIAVPLTSAKLVLYRLESIYRK